MLVLIPQVVSMASYRNSVSWAMCSLAVRLKHSQKKVCRSPIILLDSNILHKYVASSSLNSLMDCHKVAMYFFLFSSSCCLMADTMLTMNFFRIKFVSIDSESSPPFFDGSFRFFMGASCSKESRIPPLGWLLCSLLAYEVVSQINSLFIARRSIFLSSSMEAR